MMHTNSNTAARKCSLCFVFILLLNEKLFLVALHISICVRHNCTLDEVGRVFFLLDRIAFLTSHVLMWCCICIDFSLMTSSHYKVNKLIKRSVFHCGRVEFDWSFAITYLLWKKSKGSLLWRDSEITWMLKRINGKGLYNY